MNSKNIGGEHILKTLLKINTFKYYVTSTPTRPVENVVLTTKDLQEINIQILDGTTVENKGKTIN